MLKTEAKERSANKTKLDGILTDLDLWWFLVEEGDQKNVIMFGDEFKISLTRFIIRVRSL